jgi:probable HAF family extracellular repeat protein
MRKFAMALVLAVAIAACGTSDQGTGGGSSAVPAGGGGAPVPDAGPAPAPPVPDAGPAPAPAPAPAPDPGDADGGPGDSTDGGVATGGADGGTASQPPAYSVTDLGNAIPTFIDAHGTVAGSVCDATACAGATFTTSRGWMPAPVPSGARWVVPTGIDAAGRLAMNAEFPGTMRSTYSLPYRSSPLELVPILATDAHDLTHGSHLNAVNPAGHLVGTFYENAFGPSETSGSYFYDGAVTRILQAPPLNRSEALAINSHDQVVGWMQVGPEQHGFLWDHGTLRDLGTVSGASTMATAINDSGVVTGWGATSPTSGVSIAFRWDGQMHALGCPSGTIHCETFAINARGDIVGEALVSITGGDVGFLHRDGVFYRLADLVQDAPGWQFDIARAINDAGQIVGTGRLDGKGHAFLLTPR